MTRRAARDTLPFVAITFVASACSAAASNPVWTYGPTLGTTPSAPPTLAPSAAPSGSAGAGGSSAPSAAILRLAAKNIAFDQSQLTAPANTPFEIVFDNQEDGIPHNVAIFTDASASTKVFSGDIVTGPGERTYDVPALTPGSYFFRCDVHPTQMTGTLVVQ